MSSESNTKQAIGLKGPIVAIIILALAFIAFFNRQLIYDTVEYHTYKPTATMQSFVKRTTMNGEGQFLFYSAHPELETAAQFNKNCPTQDTSMAILGCYNGQQIFIYDIDNSKLDGIREVTAAYEMLHAAYKRLSPSDRANLDSLIEQAYSDPSNQSLFKQSVDYFAKTEPGERDNELFSLIATQVKTVNPKLEAYYSRYFTNRQAIVAMYNKYSSVFTQYTTQLTALEVKLQNMSDDIKTRTAQYNEDVASVNAAIQSFNSRANSGGFSSQSEFNSDRAALLQQVDSVNQEQASINQEIDSYNQLLQQYNQSVLATKQLYNSINSLAPAPSV